MDEEYVIYIYTMEYCAVIKKENKILHKPILKNSFHCFEYSLHKQIFILLSKYRDNEQLNQNKDF